MGVISQLLTPARYLKVKDGSGGKVVVDLILPGLLALGTTGVWWWRPDLLTMGGASGLLLGIAGLMQILVGFYVATLAAIATFPASSLDEPTNRLTLDGALLKRRRFLAYLFGYLALLSIALVICLLFRPIAQGLLLDASAAPWSKWVRIGLVYGYQFIFWQMVSITLLGLYYLTDRIHRSDNE